MVKISFVCPIFNKSEYLEEVLNSIKTQVGSFDKEYIFIDDGSEDDSFERLKCITKNWKDTKILTQKNSGPAVATQKGISLSKGSYIKLVGGDDVMVPDCTLTLLEVIKKKKSVAAFSKYSLVKKFNNISYSKNNKLKNFRILSNPLIQTIKSNFSGTTPTLYEHDAIKKSGGCNKKIFIEDFSLVLGLTKFGSFSFVDNITSFGPKYDKKRIMNNKKTQLMHDYNAALYYYFKKFNHLELDAKIIACKKALGRAHKWAIRNSKVQFFNQMFLKRIILEFGFSNHLNLLKQSCNFFYNKIDVDEIRYKIK